ncbi:unnamed protein product [Phytophthora fragariaefolia]|uniref:Unnamed protein product n=1 Tax=Phytophthora fragariaefolia TaxID=1490495 RepID=A0A9W6TPY6_9STRA|nr:unnamed protein product [Phytophthora fragariaefolia]
MQLLASTCGGARHGTSSRRQAKRIHKMVSSFAKAARDNNATLKEHSVYELLNVAITEEDLPLIISSEVIPLAVSFSRDGTAYQKERGLQALERMSRGGTKAAIVAAGGIRVLLDAAQNGNYAQKKHAARALFNLSANRYCQTEIKAANGEHTLKGLAQQGFSAHNSVAAAALRNLSSSFNPC